MCVVYTGIILTLACTFGYVNIQDSDVDIQFIHVNMPHNYVYLQYNYVNMRDDNVIIQINLSYVASQRNFVPC